MDFLIQPKGFERTFLWDVETTQCLRIYSGHSKAVTSVAFSPDGSKILTASDDNTMRLWDAESDTCLRIYAAPPSIGEKDSGIGMAAFSPDGSKILSTGKDNSVRIWNANSMECQRSFEAFNYEIAPRAAFSPDSKRVIAGTRTGKAFLWDIDSSKCLNVWGASAYPVRTGVFSPDGKMVLTYGDSQPIRLWDAGTGLLIRAFGELPNSRGYCAAFSSDGSLILTERGNTAYLWDAGSTATLGSFKGHNANISYLGFLPNRDRFLTCSNDEAKGCLWDSQTSLPLKTYSFGSLTTAFALSPDGTSLLVGYLDGYLRLIDIATGNALRTYPSYAGRSGAIAFSPSGKQFVATGPNGRICLWNTDSETSKKMFNGYAEGLAFAPDGIHFFSSIGRYGHMWSTESIFHLASREGVDIMLTSASPDSSGFLATDSYCIKFWRVNLSDLIGVNDAKAWTDYR